MFDKTRGEKKPREAAQALKGWLNLANRPGALAQDLRSAVAVALGTIADQAARQGQRSIKIPAPPVTIAIADGRASLVETQHQSFLRALDGCELARIRRCENQNCRKLFYAVHIAQVWCSAKCRDAVKKRTQYARKRAEYQRHWRRNVRAQAQRARLRAARTGRNPA